MLRFLRFHWQSLIRIGTPKKNETYRSQGEHEDKTESHYCTTQKNLKDKPIAQRTYAQGR